MSLEVLLERKNWIASLALVSLSVFGALEAQDLPSPTSSGGQAINWTQAVSQNGEESLGDPLVAPPGSWDRVPAVDPVPPWERETIWDLEPFPELLPGLWQSAALSPTEEGRWAETVGLFLRRERLVANSLPTGLSVADFYFLLGTSLVVALLVCQVRRRPDAAPQG